MILIVTQNRTRTVKIGELRITGPQTEGRERFKSNDKMFHHGNDFKQPAKGVGVLPIVEGPVAGGTHSV